VVIDPLSEAFTFVFADVESSTRLWERFPDAMKDAIERHEAILRAAVDRGQGQVVKVTGDGLMAVFASPSDGVLACLEGQRMLNDEAWGETGPLRVRMGIHLGRAQRRAGDFFGPSVNRTARIMAAAHGGQVLLSARAADLARRDLPAEASLRDLGEHRLKDLSRPERIFQLMHPGLHGEFPPLATLTHRPNNLPAPTSEFLGREAQLAAVRDLLDAEGLRLVTLTGPGGIGKTRLALQAAADQIDRFEDGVYFVDLSFVRQPSAALAAIVRCLDLTPRGDEPLETLTVELREKHMLLLLDNFEQVVAAAEPIVDLLQRCPRVKVLVTSREALRVRGEHLFPVPPLSLPGARLEQASAEIAREFEAVRLFVARAQDACPGLALTDDNAAAVIESCARLDGLPLAIELVAARLNLFSPKELNERLGHRLDFLPAGARDLPARQETLRSTIAWSYELLNEDERALFEVVSLFFPGRVKTIEEVVGRVESLQRIDVVGRLASLVDKSLVRNVNGDRPRLEMLGTIREYASEQRERSELGTRARKAHAEYFSEVVRSSGERLTGSERDQALDDLSSEMGNLMAAWRYWVDAGDLEQLHTLLDPLWAFLDARGRYRAAIELTDDLLRVLATVPPTPERTREEIMLRTSLARALMAIGGYTREVDEAYGRALELSDTVGEVPQRFPVLRSLATFHLYRGEFAQAAAAGQELMDLAAQEGDLDLGVEGHVVLGSSRAFLGDVPAGLRQLDRAIAQFNPEHHRPRSLQLGASPGVVAHTASALLLWLQGFPDRARERATNGVELAQGLNHPFTLAYALFHVGLLDLWRRDFDLAYERSSGALDVANEHDYQVWEALALTLQGAASVGLDRAAEGLSQTDRGLALYQGLDTPPVFWPLLLSVKASAEGLAGRLAKGVDAINRAIELSGESNVAYPEFAVLRGDLILRLGDTDTAEKWFRSALDVAAGFGLRMPQLHAAVRIARISQASGTHRDAADVLRKVYEMFTEGFETLDLTEARSALHELREPMA
jgi:predicted ATPase/class 3 adenylate cyclase